MRAVLTGLLVLLPCATPPARADLPGACALCLEEYPSNAAPVVATADEKPLRLKKKKRDKEPTIVAGSDLDLEPPLQENEYLRLEKVVDDDGEVHFVTRRVKVAEDELARESDQEAALASGRKTLYDVDVASGIIPEGVKRRTSGADKKAPPGSHDVEHKDEEKIVALKDIYKDEEDSFRPFASGPTVGELRGKKPVVPPPVEEEDKPPKDKKWEVGPPEPPPVVARKKSVEPSEDDSAYVPEFLRPSYWREVLNGNPAPSKPMVRGGPPPPSAVDGDLPSSVPPKALPPPSVPDPSDDPGPARVHRSEPVDLAVADAPRDPERVSGERGTSTATGGTATAGGAPTGTAAAAGPGSGSGGGGGTEAVAGGDTAPGAGTGLFPNGGVGSAPVPPSSVVSNGNAYRPAPPSGRGTVSAPAVSVANADAPKGGVAVQAAPSAPGAGQSFTSFSASSSSAGGGETPSLIVRGNVELTGPAAPRSVGAGPLTPAPKGAAVVALDRKSPTVLFFSSGAGPAPAKAGAVSEGSGPADAPASPGGKTTLAASFSQIAKGPLGTAAAASAPAEAAGGTVTTASAPAAGDEKPAAKPVPASAGHDAGAAVAAVPAPPGAAPPKAARPWWTQSVATLRSVFLPTRKKETETPAGAKAAARDRFRSPAAFAAAIFPDLTGAAEGESEEEGAPIDWEKAALRAFALGVSLYGLYRGGRRLVSMARGRGASVA